MEAPSHPPSLRLFIAVRLPAVWRHALAHLIEELERHAPGYARWVRPELLHLTLVFLGYQRPTDLAAIEEAIREAAGASEPFGLALDEVGAFGPEARPRVIWVGVLDEGQRLLELHRRLRTALRQRHVHFDERPLVPHITLGRAKREATAEGGRQLREALTVASAHSPRPEALSVKTISVMRSELFREGPRYTEVKRFRLGRGA